MHRRMGHRSLRAVIAAEASGIWEGVRLRQTPDEYCVDCHIGGIPRAKRGQSPPSEATQPGAVLFLDVIPNPAHGGPTPSTSFSDYLEVACAYSRYFAFVGLKSTTSYDIIEGVKQFVVDHRPREDFQLNDVKEIHVDAGSYFLSDEFINWGRSHGIKVVSAAPHHQEMNGLAERLWQTSRVMAFKMLSHARLPMRARTGAW